MKKSNISYFSCLFPMSIILLPPFSFAEEDSPVELSGPFEIIEVTAQKRLQKVEDVSISVTALSGDTLKALGMSTTHEIASQLPGVTISDVAGTPNNVLISIRGASQNDFGDHNESSSAVYIDQAYVGAIGGVGIQLYDMDRVEVLRGPQGTLFGRNATGGLVHFVTKKPSAQTDGYLEVEYGSYNRVRLEGAVGGGTDTLSGRLSGLYLEQDGYIKNRIGEDMISADRESLRGQLLYTPNDNLEVLFKASYGNNNDHPGATYEHRASFVGDSDFGRSVFLADDVDVHGTCAGCDAFGYKDTDGDVWESDIDALNAGTVRTVNQYTANVQWTADTFTFASISDYQGTRKVYDEDCDGSPNSVCVFGSYQDTTQYSQEFRFEGESDDFQWVAGTNFLNIDGDYEIHLWSDIIDYFSSSVFNLRTKSVAVFGQLEYDLADDLMLTVGGRWTRDSRDFGFVNRLLTGPDRNLPSIGSVMSFNNHFIADKQTSEADCAAMGAVFQADGFCDKTALLDTDTGDSDYSARLALDYHLTDDTLLYASFTRGTKGGGYSAPFAPNMTVEEVPYDQEVIHNYEAGWKTSFLNHKAYLTAAVFYADYRDYQGFNLKGLTQVIINSDAYLQGGELELLLALDDGWSFNFGLSILEAKVKDKVLPDKVTKKDTYLPQAPTYTFNALAHKSWRLESGAKISAQLDILVSGSQYFSIANHKTTYDNGYAVGNARFSYQNATGQWEVSAWIKNLWEEEYATYGFDAAADFGYSFLSFAPPRTAGLTFTYKFGEQ